MEIDQSLLRGAWAPFTITHVVIDRCSSTTLVLIGSRSLPPSASVVSTSRGRSSYESIAAIRKANPSGRSRQVSLDADARRQPGEEQAARDQDSPHLVDDPAELTGIGDEVQDRAADDGVERRVVPWERGERPLTDVGVDVEALRQRPCRGDRTGVLVDRVNVESSSQQVGKISAAAAAGIQDPAPAIETAAEQLIEEIDVELPEETLQLLGWRSHDARISRRQALDNP